MKNLPTVRQFLQGLGLTAALSGSGVVGCEKDTAIGNPPPPPAPDAGGGVDSGPPVADVARGELVTNPPPPWPDAREAATEDVPANPPDVRDMASREPVWTDNPPWTGPDAQDAPPVTPPDSREAPFATNPPWTPDAGRDSK